MINLVFAVLAVIPVKNVRQLLMSWALPSLRSNYKSALVLSLFAFTASTAISVVMAA